MSMLRTGTIVVLAIITMLLVADRLHRPSHDRDLARQRAELKKAQRELRDASAQQARRAWQPARPWNRQAAPEPARPEPTDMIDETEMGGQTGETEPPRTTEETHAAIEDLFAAEPQDASWSAHAHQRALGGLERTLPEGSTLLSLRCSGSMCRIETSHADMDEYHRFVDKAFMQPATALWNAGFFSSVVADSQTGEVTVVSFLARDEQPLPVISRL